MVILWDQIPRNIECIQLRTGQSDFQKLSYAQLDGTMENLPYTFRTCDSRFHLVKKYDVSDF